MAIGSRTDPAHGHPCAEQNCLLASVVLVDSRGWLLLQERDEHAPTSPNQWALVGGHLDPGEDWEAGMRRELAEETGLTDVDGLEPWFDELIRHSPKVSTHLADRWRIWVGAADLTDDDIAVGEGRQIVFVDPAAVRSCALDLDASARNVLPMLLDSSLYASLRARG